MATTPTKPDIAGTASFTGVNAPAWPRGQNPELGLSTDIPDQKVSDQNPFGDKPSQRDALQALLAFSALHDQVRRRKALAARLAGFDAGAPFVEFEADEQFVLDEVLRLVAERALAITGADGLAIALAENDEIVLRASAGTVRPDVGQRIDRDSAFSGACFRMAEIVTCDDTETDSRVNLQACRRLGARSMVAVPLCGRRRVIGLLEAFSAWPFAFNESDVRNLSLLAELVLGALKPEDEDRFAQSAQVAAKKLAADARSVQTPAATPVIPQQIAADQHSAGRPSEGRSFGQHCCAGYYSTRRRSHSCSCDDHCRTGCRSARRDRRSLPERVVDRPAESGSRGSYCDLCRGYCTIERNLSRACECGAGQART